MDTLKPCPFCGLQVVYEQEEIYCECGVHYPQGSLQKNEDFFEAWNKRASEWVSVKDRLPESGEVVICCYPGVYDARIVTYWHDGVNAHFGTITELDGRGSQPAKYWMPLPAPPKGE